MQLYMFYFDNNSTTIPAKCVLDAMHKWESCYNPSSGFSDANKVKKMIDNSIDFIQDHNNAHDHSIIFTSGGSESNCTAIRTITDSFRAHTNQFPHVITSAIEHHSILECLHNLEELKMVEVSYILPDKYGQIDPKDVVAEIKETTCLVSIMYANNELGTINDIEEINRQVKENGILFRIPFHTDAVQIYGKKKIDMKNIDCLSASFHKLYGPKGSGLLIMRNDIIDGFKIKSLISGSQQNSLRGGTENPPAIAGAIKSIQYTFKNREEKNKKLELLREYFITSLDEIIPVIKFDDVKEKLQYNKKFATILGINQVPSTVMLCICDPQLQFCNVKFKKKLEKKKIIVSIASACLTDQENASHVLQAIGAEKYIKKGCLRISFSDNTMKKDINYLLKILDQFLN